MIVLLVPATPSSFAGSPTFPVLPALGRDPAPAGGWLDAAFGWVAGSVDAAVLAAMQVIVDRIVAPAPEDVARIRRSAAAFLEPEVQRAPEAFLDAVRRDGALRSRETYRGPIADGIRMDRQIDWDASDPMHVEQWLHGDGGARATVVAVHGFGMGSTRRDAYALFAHRWFREGLDVALYTLPLHGTRTPSDARFSGERFAVPDIAAMNRVLRQALHELAALVTMLRAETGAPVGVIGLSMGALLASLLASRDPELDFVVPIAPPVCLGDIAWRFFERSRRRPEIASAALDRDELRASFRVHSPLAYQLRVPRDRGLLVAGRGDRIVPPEHAHALWRHWGEPDMFWFSGSHLAPVGRRSAEDAIARHLRRCGIS